MGGGGTFSGTVLFVYLVRLSSLCSPPPEPAPLLCHPHPRHPHLYTTTTATSPCPRAPPARCSYSLSPEAKFPTAVEEAANVVQELTSHRGTQLNIDIRRVFVAGDSAGGNLAAAAVLHLIQTHPNPGSRRPVPADHPGNWRRLRGLLLFYPVTHAGGSYPSRTLYEHVPPLSWTRMAVSGSVWRWGGVCLCVLCVGGVCVCVLCVCCVYKCVCVGGGAGRGSKGGGVASGWEEV